jgi:hypothetical protein
MRTEFKIEVASSEHLAQAEAICRQIAESALLRGTGIAGRTPAYLRQKMLDGKAVVATLPDGQWIGFAYLETWEENQFVSQSGLIVNPTYRELGVARRIKKALFDLSRHLFPGAKIVSITTSQAVMTLNNEL